MPSLPVDSAMSCSAQAPKSAIFFDDRIVTLSRPSSAGDGPWQGRAARRGSRPGGTSGPQERAMASACLTKRLDIDARGCRRHQAERREHRIAPADGGLAVEDARIVQRLRRLLQRRAGIGDRNEAMAGLDLRPDRLRDALVEIILHRVRFGGAAGLAGDDEHGVGDVDPGLHRPDLRRIGGIQHVQLREAGLLAEGLGQHLRPEARSAHAEHDGVGEFLALHAAAHNPR